MRSQHLTREMFIALTGARMPVWQTDFLPDLFGSSSAEKMDNRHIHFRCSEVFEAWAGKSGLYQAVVSVAALIQHTDAIRISVAKD
jgi:hypothetical protein